MHEQRLTRRLLKHWDMVRGDETIPDALKFNPAAIEDVWPSCFRVEVNSRGKKPVYHYDYMGSPVAEMYGRDLTGTIVDQTTKQFPGKVLHYKFDQVLDCRSPLYDDGHFINEAGRLIKYRACILPLGTAKKGVSHIVVGITCRYF